MQQRAAGPESECNLKGSQSYRAANADRFVKLGEGKFGGFRPGVANGPPPSTKRGKARTKVKWG